MKSARQSGAGFIALGIGGALALNYPLLSLFDRSTTVFGIPLPFLHLFVVWTLLIAGIGVLAEWRSTTDANRSAENRAEENGSLTVPRRRPRADD